MIADVEGWKAAVLWAGRIVQDDDTSVTQEERERRFNRYIELVDMVTGEEQDEVVRALIDSLQARHDYGAYQSTMDKLARFPSRAFGQPFLEAFLPLISRQPEWAGDLLLTLIKDPNRILYFNAALAGASPAARDTIMAFIQAQENDNGWLSDHVGLLRPANWEEALTDET